MNTKRHLPFLTLLLMISFASVNAVLFTPALPSITQFFAVTTDVAQQTMTWYLVGYALGQLLYGPISNRFGRKPALFAGIILEIASNLLCVLAGMTHEYYLLIIGRFFTALGAGVGLKMTFTLVNECYSPAEASKKVSYLMLAFAITPGLAVAIGGLLNQHFGWISCFYAGAIYGVILLLFTRKLPETQTQLNYDALKFHYLVEEYTSQLKNKKLISGGLLMGSATSFVYVFAALAPFIAINIFNMSSSEYGFANLIPPIGLILGSLTCAQLTKKYALNHLVFTGILIATVGIITMLIAMILHSSALTSVFLSMIIIYFGLCFILANASTITMSHVSDKSQGSAIMNFLNMGLATLVVLSLQFFPVKTLLLPGYYLMLSFMMYCFYRFLSSSFPRMRESD